VGRGWVQGSRDGCCLKNGRIISDALRICLLFMHLPEAAPDFFIRCRADSSQVAKKALLIEVMVTFLVTLAPRGPRGGTLLPLIRRAVRLTEALAAPVHAPDFKSDRATHGSTRRFTQFCVVSRVSACAPSARQLQPVAGRWLHFGDTSADSNRDPLS
jgi:hypothetical protein